MNGGTWESVASYVDSGATDLATYGGTASGDLYGANVEERAKSTAYKMVYKGNGNQSSAYNTAKQYKGDAVYEISNSYNTSTNSWFLSHSHFFVSKLPFGIRGADKYMGEKSEMFSFSVYTGEAISWGVTFRPVLVP